MSERKSFAEILKENLTEKSFKNKPASANIFQSTSKSIPIIILDPFQKEIHNYFINIKDISIIHSSKTFYAKLFKNPVKISFYWCEEDWQGSIFAVYKYSGKFISVNGNFGSCSGCDAFISDSEEVREHSQERLDKIFLYSLTINNSINDINIHGYDPEYTHLELISKFQNWKELQNLQYNKEKIKEEIKKEIKEEIKQTCADIVFKKK